MSYEVRSERATRARRRGVGEVCREKLFGV